MQQMYSLPTRAQRSDASNESDHSRKQGQSSNSSGSSGGMPQMAGKFAKGAGKVAKSTPGKIFSTGGLLMALLLSLLFGLAYLVRSLKNVKLTLRLMLKRNGKARKKH